MSKERIVEWSRDSEERKTHTLDAIQLWRNVAWAGLSTGRVWRLDDPAVKEDPAGFAPLWALLEYEPPVTDDP